MKKTIGIGILVVLLLLSSGAASWLWIERATINNQNATMTAEYGTLKDQITKADQVQDTNRQLQQQVDDLQQQLENALSGEADPTPSDPNQPTPSDPNQPTPTPSDPNQPTPTPGGGVEPPQAVLDIMTAIEKEVIELRGLPEERPVTRLFMGRDELRDYITAEMAKDNTPDDYRRTSAEMWLLGFAPKDLDLEKLYIDLQTEQIAGFYDPEEDTFYMIGETPELPPGEQITYAHEFTHNLQDQLVDLNAGLEAGDYDADRGMAFRAVVEGDASLAMTQWTTEYLLKRMTPAEMQEMLQSLQDINTSVLDNAPAIISKGLMFPYESGQIFVERLYDEGGWDAVNQALENPPTSSEQILHPDKYLQGEQPSLPERFDLTPALPQGWTTVTTNTLGEFDMQIFLEELEAQGDTDSAAAGISGIRYALYERGTEEYLLQMTMRWDTPGDGDEFLTAFRSGIEPNGDRFRRDDVQIGIKGSGPEFTILFTSDETLLQTALAAQP